MKIIISPAKQMRVDADSFTCKELPAFIDRTEVLMKWIQSLSYEEQKKLWVCNDKIARQNAERFAHMDLHKKLTPALLAYDGIQYTYMAPAVFEDGQYDYVQEHLRILSGFYGVVKPMDGVVPYRLEMQAKAAVGGHKNLYDFWGDSLYREGSVIFFPLTETPPGASDFTRSRGVSSLGVSSSAAIAADHGGEVVDYGNGEWVVQSAGGDE